MSDEKPISLQEIRDDFQGEQIGDLIAMLVGQPITHHWRGRNPQDYRIEVTRDKEEDNPSVQALVISATNSSGKEAHKYRYPTSTDSFYDSCIDVIKELRGSG